MKKKTIVTTVRLNSQLYSQLDFIRKLPGGLSRFVEKKLSEIKVDTDLLTKINEYGIEK